MRLLRVVMILALVAVDFFPVEAYDLGTHREIAERAVSPAVSKIDEVLKNELGISRGVDQTFNGPTVSELIGRGAEAEDDPIWRAFNHFHNPLFQADGSGRGPWDQAGLNVLGAAGQSSVLWQQNPNQNTTTVRVGSFFRRARGGNHSWQNARWHYLQALTGRTQDGTTLTASERAVAFGNMFEGLGHLTHLIQDASVPDHTRNDVHIYQGYEAFVEAIRRGGIDEQGQQRRVLFLELLNQDPVVPEESIFTPTGNSQAPVPIARLIDSDIFGGLNTGVLTGKAQGIAEYTNGNFVSSDTIFLDFDLPRPESLGPGFTESEGQGERLYFSKVTDGETIQHFVAEGTWLERLLFRGRSERNDILNDRIFQDYAAKLLPRAVGYSAALLDYFFRGRLDVAVVVSVQDPSQLKLQVINRSTEAIGPGTLFLYADDPTGLRCPVRSFGSTAVPDVPGCPLGDFGAKPVSTTVEAGNPLSATPLTFQKPADAVRFVLVYEGQLGGERPDPAVNFPGAVIGKVFAQPFLEIAFVGTINGVTGFYLVSEQGTFAIREDLLGGQFFDIAWGQNDNTLLLHYRPPSSFAPVLQAVRIKREKGSSDVPVKTQFGSTVFYGSSGIPVADTEDITQPRRLIDDVLLGRTVTVRENLAVRSRLVTFYQETNSGAGGTFNPIVVLNPALVDETFNVTFEQTHNMNLDGRAVGNPNVAGAYDTVFLTAFVNENDALIAIYRIKWKIQGLWVGNIALDNQVNPDLVRRVPVFGAQISLVSPLGIPDEEDSEEDIISPSGGNFGITGTANGSAPHNDWGEIGPDSFSVFQVGNVKLLPQANVFFGREGEDQQRPEFFDVFAMNMETRVIVAASFTNPVFEWDNSMDIVTHAWVAYSHGDGDNPLGDDHTDSMSQVRFRFTIGAAGRPDPFLLNSGLNTQGYITSPTSYSIVQLPDIEEPSVLRKRRYQRVKNFRFSGRDFSGLESLRPDPAEEILIPVTSLTQWAQFDLSEVCPAGQPTSPQCQDFGKTHPEFALEFDEGVIKNPFGEPEFIEQSGISVPFINNRAPVLAIRRKETTDVDQDQTELSAIRWQFPSSASLLPFTARRGEAVVLGTLRAHDAAVIFETSTPGVSEIVLNGVRRDLGNVPEELRLVLPNSYTSRQDNRIYTADPTGVSVDITTTNFPEQNLLEGKTVISDPSHHLVIGR